MNPELITKAGEKAGQLVSAAITAHARKIAEYIEKKMVEKGNDVAVKLGTIRLTTAEKVVAVKYDAEIADKTDIGSPEAFVTLEPDLFDENKTEGSE